jgi:hypothetical protein
MDATVDGREREPRLLRKLAMALARVLDKRI